MNCYFLFLFFGYLTISDGYVLLQMRKQANNSNVDAVIHKKVSGEKYDKLAKRMTRSSRKQLRMQTESEEESAETAEAPKSGVTSLVVGINTGAKVQGRSSRGINELLDVVKERLPAAAPLLRSKSFEFNDGGSPHSTSMGIELDTASILDSVKKYVSSPRFKRAAEDIARKAAIIFRALKDEM